jgi:hypothetical protein
MAAEYHRRSCCASHGGVFSSSCPVIYQLSPGQSSFVQVDHTIEDTIGSLQRLQDRAATLMEG